MDWEYLKLFQNYTENGTGFEDMDTDLWKHVIEDFEESQYTLKDPVTILLLALYVAIFLTSVVGNSLVLIVIVPNKQMWNVTNNFLVNLAVADLLVTLLCMPMTVAGKVYKLWIYGDILCKATPYLQGVSVAASTFTITVMSVDRCLAILYPLKFRNIRTERNVRTLIAVIWLVAGLLMVPLLIVNKTKSQEIFTNFRIITCAEHWGDISQRMAYDFSLLFIVCLIPAQIVFVSYLLMGKRLWVTDSRLKDEDCPKVSGTKFSTRGSINTVKASRRRTAKMCMVVSIVFVVCWLPYYVVNIHLDFKGDGKLLDVVYWGLFIGHLHCITNPILYCFMHKSFRYGAKKILPCLKAQSKTFTLRSRYGAADCGTSDPSSSPGSVRPSIHRPKVNRPARHALRVETTKSSIESSSVLLDNPNDDLKETINYTNNYTKGSNLSPEYCSRPRRVKVTISKIKSGLNGKTSLKVEHVTDICARDSLNNI